MSEERNRIGVPVSQARPVRLHLSWNTRSSTSERRAVACTGGCLAGFAGCAYLSADAHRHHHTTNNSIHTTTATLIIISITLMLLLLLVVVVVMRMVDDFWWYHLVPDWFPSDSSTQQRTCTAVDAHHNQKQQPRPPSPATSFFCWCWCSSSGVGGGCA